MTGEDDPIAPPTAVQALADAIKSAKVRILARCGHWTPLEAAEAMRTAGVRTTSGRSRPEMIATPESGEPTREGEVAMADDRIGGSNGVVFTNVRIIDGSGEYPYSGEVVVQGNRIRQVTKGASRLSHGTGRRRADSDRRDGRDVDARTVRRASPPLVEQRAGDRSNPDDASRGAHTGHRANGQARARRRLHRGTRRGGGQAPPRRRRPQRNQSAA